MIFAEFSKTTEECYTVDKGFLLWKINGKSITTNTKIDGGKNNILTHVIVYEGQMEIESGGTRHLMTKNTLGNFIDHRSFKIIDMTSNIKAYLMSCDDIYAQSLLKNNPPFPFSYVLDIREKPISLLSPQHTGLFVSRMSTMREICRDESHLFKSSMIKYALGMLLMDMANIYIKQQKSEQQQTLSTRKSELFRTFMKMLPTHVCHERSVAFYASSLCITPQYLNRIVKQYTFKTASQWI
ncbi:MAG: hypothetical protein ACI4TR_02810, partial [Bacteroidaceae bacterium]